MTKPLVVFEMANNHGGKVEHGIEIIQAFGELVKPFKDRFDFGFKLQYRDLDTFIHPAYKDRMDLKFVKRFTETRLDEFEFLALRSEMDMNGFIPVCTPFDEVSVDLVEKHNYQYLKIASCSFGDWPLMERIALSKLPIIASTAGASLETLDHVVAFLEHRNRPLILLHCIGAYPTPMDHLQLNQIDFLKHRYPQHRIGLSSHENPNEIGLISMAIAKGASVFEKHVGIDNLNAYSCNPEQMNEWLLEAANALDICGSSGRYEPSVIERVSLGSLRRGAYAKEAIKGGEVIGLDKVFFAMPTEVGQLTANDCGKYSEFKALFNIPKGGEVYSYEVIQTDRRKKIVEIVEKVKDLLKASHVTLSEKADVEISHHYGLDEFEFTGLTIINIVNRAYCKKLLVLLPGQSHPEQYHKKKEETFHVLHGEVRMILDGVDSFLYPGDVVTVEKKVRHSFGSRDGAVIEEISTTHYKNDSFYTDPAIALNLNRKTQLTYFFG